MALTTRQQEYHRRYYQRNKAWITRLRRLPEARERERQRAKRRREYMRQYQVDRRVRLRALPEFFVRERQRDARRRAANREAYNAKQRAFYHTHAEYRRRKCVSPPYRYFTMRRRAQEIPIWLSELVNGLQLARRALREQARG